MSILCLGLDATLEGEEGDTGNEFCSGDKPDLELPACQRRLLSAIVALGKPVVVVNATGSAVRLEEGNAIFTGLVSRPSGRRGGGTSAVRRQKSQWEAACHLLPQRG